MALPLLGKVALITGANRGIGKAISITLGKAGATIIGVSFAPEHIDEINSFIQEYTLNGQGFIMDVTKIDSIEAAMANITQTYGYPSILINNAGITRDNLILRMSQAEWDEVISTNLNSVFTLSKLCVRNMIKNRWGRIVNMASVVGMTGNAGQANYAASKAGVIAFTKSLAQEVASRGVTVNAVAPGYIDTAMTGQLSETIREAILNSIPMKRPGQPQDIADTVAFLVSDAASYITGVTIPVCGGMVMI